MSQGREKRARLRRKQNRLDWLSAREPATNRKQYLNEKEALEKQLGAKNDSEQKESKEVQ